MNTQNGEEPDSRSPCSLIVPHLVGETRARVSTALFPQGPILGLSLKPKALTTWP